MKNKQNKKVLEITDMKDFNRGEGFGKKYAHEEIIIDLSEQGKSALEVGSSILNNIDLETYPKLLDLKVLLKNNQITSYQKLTDFFNAITCAHGQRVLVDLSGNPMGKNGMKVLCDNLGHCPFRNNVTFVFRNTGIDDRMLSSLADTLDAEGFPLNITIDLRGNDGITEEGVNCFLKKLDHVNELVGVPKGLIVFADTDDAEDKNYLNYFNEFSNDGREEKYKEREMIVEDERKEREIVEDQKERGVYLIEQLEEPKSEGSNDISVLRFNFFCMNKKMDIPFSFLHEPPESKNTNGMKNT